MWVNSSTPHCHNYITRIIFTEVTEHSWQALDNNTVMAGENCGSANHFTPDAHSDKQNLFCKHPLFL